MLNVAFLLDITGSMSCELDGVKATVSRLVTTVFADFPNEIVVTIITFTESEKGCYVTRDSFADGSEAASFVNKITLCVPPGMPSVNAHGGDGPENHKAALAELMRLDADVPTVAFLITDAVPHLLDVPSTEATLERNYLSHEYGLVDSDLFTLLDRLVDHFGDSLVLSVVKYYHTTDHALYGAVAKRLNGVLVTPVQRTPEQLANGLMAILLQMFQSLAGAAMTAPSENAETATALSAFSFYDLEAVEIPLNERGRSAIATPHVGSTDELLFKLIERTTVIAGGRFKKRAITAHLVSEQVELLLVMAKGLLREISKDEALERATLLLGKIKALMGEEHASQFKLRVDELDALLSNDAFAAPTANAVTGDLEVAVSAITLMSIEETARDVMLEGEVDAEAPEPRDPYTALLAVASLFLGHLSVLQLPTRMGVVDFMDAWSAVIQKVSNDVVSATDFLTMIGDKESVAGLQRRDSEYNFLQLVADPKDAVGSELLRVASGTQVLDILTALLSGAPAGLFSPNMFRGTISACLMTLLSTHDADLSEYQWEIAHKMVHTVRLLMGVTPGTVVWEPESAMGKLLFRVLRMPVAIVRGDETILRAFLEEMAAARAQKFAKYNERDYLTLVEELVGYEHDTSSVERDVFEPHVLLDGTELPVDAAHAVAVVTKSTFCANFERCAGNVLRAVFLQDGDSENVPSLTQVWPAYTHDLPKLLLLQKRTERYTLQKAETAEDKDAWVRNAAIMAASLDGADEDVFRVRALVLMRQKYDAFIRETRKQRQDEAAQERWRRVVAFMRSPLEQFTTQLSTFVYSSARREHKLLLKAFTMYGGELDTNEYEAKVTVVVTGRVVGNDSDGASDRVVFNRGNLHAHPDRFVPMTDAFKAKLRAWQRTHKWSTAHVYRESGVPNHSGFSNANPSAWAARRANGDERTFWEDDEN